MKKKNLFAAYFEDFGLRQISQMLLVCGMIVMIVSFFLTDAVQACTILVVVGASIIAVASAIGLAYYIITAVKTNRHRAEFKNAIVNIVISSVLLVAAVVGIVLSALELVVY